MINARDALQRLIDGNRRFAVDGSSVATLANPSRRDELVERQEPIAAILGCSDSRVPAEIVFDQGLGDLFVIRVAGNIIAPSLVGSVEFAAMRLGVRLVVVLGHSRCGAVEATLDALEQPAAQSSPNLSSIVDRIRPTVQSLREASPALPREDLVAHAIRANTRASVNHLRHGSQLLEELIENEGLVVVGAEYSLETGLVDFFDMPSAGMQTDD